jgi:hypothetical protein
MCQLSGCQFLCHDMDLALTGSVSPGYESTSLSLLIHRSLCCPVLQLCGYLLHYSQRPRSNCSEYDSAKTSMNAASFCQDTQSSPTATPCQKNISSMTAPASDTGSKMVSDISADHHQKPSVAGVLDLMRNLKLPCLPSHAKVKEAEGRCWVACCSADSPIQQWHSTPCCCCTSLSRKHHHN